MQVKDLMTTDVITVSPSTKIGDIAQVLFKNRIHAVPVMEDEKVIGIITENDFFTRDSKNVFLPSYIEFIKGTKVFSDISKNKKEKLDKLINIEARDIMTKNCVSILEDMKLEDLLKFFQETKFISLPVINEEEKLVGIITISDIIGIIKA